MSISSPFTFYLLTESLPTSFTGRVNGTPADPYMSITFDGGTVGAISPIPGMSVWFGTSAGDNDIGVLRLRSFAGSTTGLISVAESDDVGPVIANDYYITIKIQFRLWPIYPRAVIAGNDATVYIDYDIPYSDQLSAYKPVAVAGPPAVEEYNGATFSAQFVGDRSFAVAPGATITGYLWTAPGSVEGTSTSQGTEASPVTFSWTSPGQKLVYLRVTDSNGKTATNYTWAWGIDPNSLGDVAFVDFDSQNDNFDFEQGGGSATFTVHGAGDTSNFPNETLVVMASRPNETQTTPTGSWPFRDNVHFVGYILGDTVRQAPHDSDVTFTAASIDTLLKNVTAYPASLTFKTTPTDWTTAQSLTPDRAASYLWHYGSTLSLMAPIRPSNYTALIWRQDFGPSSGQYGQLDSELLQTMWGRLVVNHQGVVHHLIDYNLMNDTERSAITTRKTLHKGVWVDDVTIEERNAYSLPVNVVNMSGVFYPGGDIEDVCPLFSQAPGNAYKVFGSEQNYDRLILTSQTDLNVRCGRALAKLNAKYPRFDMQFINDGSFTIAPQELFPSNIEAGDNDRALALTTSLIPRRISRTYDHDRGVIQYSVGFEPATDGPPGVTVDMPCGPPEQQLSTPPKTIQSNINPSSLAASSNGSSFYFANTVGQTWERRVKDMTSLAVQDMIPDPWTYFKNGHDIDHIILWQCGAGFVTRSGDTGQNWSDHTSYLDAPPNSWGDGSAPTVSGTVYKQIVGDIFKQDTFYLLLQNSESGLYRGWLQRTTDDGFTFSSYALTGSSQAYPVRMDIDKQDGTILWVTLWEGNGNLNLRKYGITASGLTLSSTTTIMTGTTVGTITSDIYTARPLAPPGNKSLVYLYGRMSGPLVTGTIAIMKSSNGGSNFTSVIGDWADNICGSLAVGEADGGGNRKVYAVKNG